MALTDSQEKQKEKQMKYWKDRETEQLKHYITEEAAYQKQIEEIYNYMMNQIQKEIAQFYAKYAVKEGITLAEAKKRVSKLDIEEYERKAEKYVKEKDFSDQANEEMRLYNATMKINRLELLKANIGLELVDGFNDLQKYFDTILTDRTLEEFERQAGILGKSIQDNKQAAHAIVNASFANAEFSDRIWMYQDLMKAELSNLLRVGLIQGRNPKALAGELVKKFDVSRKNAERLMRTELARVQTEAQKQSFERNGYEEYQFHALGSACGICKDLDGKHFKIKDMEIAVNAPPCHPNCRCSTSAWMDRDEFEKWLSERENNTSEVTDKAKSKNLFGKAHFKTGDADIDTYVNDKRTELFFGKPIDITKSWKKSNKEKGTVSDLSEYTINGETFKVDGKRVLLDYSKHEKEVANVIADLYGKNVQMVPRITYPQGISTPDFQIDGMGWDLKTISTGGKNVFYNAVKKKKRQANSFIFDVTNCPLNATEIDQQVTDLFRTTHLTFIDEVGIYEKDEIVKVYRRNKK